MGSAGSLAPKSSRPLKTSQLLYCTQQGGSDKDCQEGFRLGCLGFVGGGRLGFKTFWHSDTKGFCLRRAQTKSRQAAT